VNIIKKYRVLFGFIFGFIYLYFFFTVEPNKINFIPSAILILLGIIIRIISSGYIKKSEELSVYGPYSYVRHPLYTGSFLLGIGFVLLIFDYKNYFTIILLITYLIAFFTVYSKTIKLEEKFLAEKFKEDFLEYKKNVKIIIPRIKPYKKGGNFSWKQVIKHKEYRASLSALFLLIIYFLRLYLF